MANPIIVYFGTWAGFNAYCWDKLGVPGSIAEHRRWAAHDARTLLGMCRRPAMVVDCAAADIDFDLLEHANRLAAIYGKSTEGEAQDVFGASQPRITGVRWAS